MEATQENQSNTFRKRQQPPKPEPCRAIGTFPKDTPALIHKIHQRMTVFKNHKMVRNIREVGSDYLCQLSALKTDPNHSTFFHMIEVEEVGPPLDTPEELREARHYFDKQSHVPSAWKQYLETGKNAPFLFLETSFISLFSKNTIVIWDIFRPPWKNYYASDVFFHQWLQAFHLGENISFLPKDFPSTLYINNVANPITRRIIKNILENEQADTYTIQSVHDPLWPKLANTSHIKYLLNLLKNYNAINKWRGDSPFRVSALQLYRGYETYHLKFTITPHQLLTPVFKN